MKNLKSILILCNLIVFAVIYLSIKDTEKLNSNKRFLIDDISSLQEFEINFNNENIAFKKLNNDWFVDSPIKWKANEMAISKFVAIFSHLKKEILFTKEELLQRGELISDYGIDNKSISFKLRNSNISTEVVLGKKTRDEKFFYADIETNKDNSNAIWRIPVEIEELTNMTSNNWLDEELIQKNIYSIDELTVNFKLSEKDYTETILKRIDNEWRFIKPFTSDANKEKVRILLNNLLTKKIYDFNFYNQDNSIKDTLISDWKIKLEIKDNGNTSTFKFSEKLIEKNLEYRYCKTSYSEHVIKVNDQFTELLSDWSSKLRERKIFEYSKDEIKRIDFIKSDNNFTIEKTDNLNWIIINRNNYNEQEIGDKQKIENFILYLNALEVRDFLSFDPTSINKEHLKKGDLVFKLKISMQDTTQRTIIVSKNDKDASLWKTLIKEESLLCLVDKSWNEIYNKKAYDFKSRHLFNDKMKIKAIQFNKIDDNITSIKINNENNVVLSQLIQGLTVSKYINKKSKKEGTWSGGDWIPWTYNLDLFNESNQKLHVLKLSNTVNKNCYLGNLSDNNLTFEIDNSKFHSVINTIIRSQ
jgi:hypothetical protein